jgi:hypothetical protein
VSAVAAGRHGTSRADACSVTWDKAQVSALGTSPVATFWVALEQNGPWGANAATQSRLDPELGRTLDAGCHQATGRFILIRRPGSHPELRVGGPEKIHTRRVYLAGGLAGRPWLLEADLDDPARLARLPLQGLAGGDIDMVREALPELRACRGPVLLICANSRRDLCCSVRGRAVALESESMRPGKVWECSHTGGHRFAPTGVLLPHGQAFGRLSGRLAVAALDAAARSQVPAELMGWAHDRGRSHLSAPGQAAESLVREQLPEPSLLALSTTVTPLPHQENAWACRVSHVDGRNWDVVALRSPTGDELPQSCGKDPVPAWQWSALSDFVR